MTNPQIEDNFFVQADARMTGDLSKKMNSNHFVPFSPTSNENNTSNTGIEIVHLNVVHSSLVIPIIMVGIFVFFGSLGVRLYYRRKMQRASNLRSRRILELRAQENASPSNNRSDDIRNLAPELILGDIYARLEMAQKAAQRDMRALGISTSYQVQNYGMPAIREHVIIVAEDDYIHRNPAYINYDQEEEAPPPRRRYLGDEPVNNNSIADPNDPRSYLQRNVPRRRILGDDTIELERITYINNLDNGLDQVNNQETSNNENSEKCVICLEAEANTIFAPCAHRCCCKRDAWIVFQRTRTCPVCRKDLEGVINTVASKDTGIRG